MEVSYNLKYEKSNFSNKVILDKEGEIIIYTKGFRLKGKGAGDKGELINFSEIKEFYHKGDKIYFVNFNKEKYVLSETGTLFDQLLTDLYKSRNEFLMDALFMKGGKLKAEYEGHFNRMSKFARPISKDRAKFRLHESSLIVLPAQQDAFVVHFNFVNFYEFDDMEYQLKIVMDSGENIFISQLGNDFEFFQEKFEAILGGMYQTVVNDVLREAFPHFHATTLLKLASKMKGGKAVSLHDIEKMDEEMARAVEDFIYEDELFKEKAAVLREKVDKYNTFYGVAQDKAVDGGFVKWIMFAIPESNIVAFSILPRWCQEGENKDHPDFKHFTYFYKIIIEKGSPADKVEDKIHEINEALVNLKFVKDPCYKDKRELKHSPYQYAIRKLPYLRILRKSYVGKVGASDTKEWHKQAEELIKKASLQQ